MKIKGHDLLVNDKYLFHCHEIMDVKREPEQPKMVEVTIKCTISEDQLNEIYQNEGF